MLIHTHTYMPNKGNKTIATVDDTPVSNAITQQKEEESLKGLRNELDNANKASAMNIIDQISRSNSIFFIGLPLIFNDK